jgi:hypothetical protein
VVRKDYSLNDSRLWLVNISLLALHSDIIFWGIFVLYPTCQEYLARFLGFYVATCGTGKRGPGYYVEKGDSSHESTVSVGGQNKRFRIFQDGQCLKSSKFSLIMALDIFKLLDQLVGCHIPTNTGPK